MTDPAGRRCCDACAEPLVLVAGRCRACGEAAAAKAPSPAALRWEGDLLVVPDRTAWPDRCLRCGDTTGARVPRAFAGRLHGLPLCGLCGPAERTARLLSSAAGGAVVLGAVLGIPALVGAAAELATGSLWLALLAAVAGLGLLVGLWFLANRRHIHLARSRAGEVLLRLPDPAAARAALEAPPAADRGRP